MSAFGLAVPCDITNVLKRIQIMSDPVIHLVCISLYDEADATCIMGNAVPFMVCR